MTKKLKTQVSKPKKSQKGLKKAAKSPYTTINGVKYHSGILAVAERVSDGSLDHIISKDEATQIMVVRNSATIMMWFCILVHLSCDCGNSVY